MDGRMNYQMTTLNHISFVKTNLVLLVVVFYGALELLFPPLGEKVYWLNFTKHTLGWTEWRSWLDLTCGGPRWTKTLSALWEIVIHESNRRDPIRAPIHPWEYPSRPWARLHIDHAGPFLGKLFLIVTDAYSKWIDVLLRHWLFPYYVPCLPLIGSDHGSGFKSIEFKQFTSSNGITHTFMSPYHPSSNGLAVQIFKRKLEGPIEFSFPTSISCNASNHNQYIPCSTLDGKETSYTIRFTTPRRNSTQGKSIRGNSWV